MIVNGEQVPLGEPLILREFLLHEGYELSKVAIEMDGEIIPRKEYEHIILQDNAALEIVAFVGGG